jgi:hypothetical protein
LVAKALVFFLEFEHHGDPREIQSLCEKRLDTSQRGDVVRAVKPGAARGAIRVKETSFLVRAEVLGPRSYQIGSDGDAVHALGVWGLTRLVIAVAFDHPISLLTLNLLIELDDV